MYVLKHSIRWKVKFCNLDCTKICYFKIKKKFWGKASPPEAPPLWERGGLGTPQILPLQCFRHLSSCTRALKPLTVNWCPFTSSTLATALLQLQLYCCRGGPAPHRLSAALVSRKFAVARARVRGPRGPRQQADVSAAGWCNEVIV